VPGMLTATRAWVPADVLSLTDRPAGVKAVQALPLPPLSAARLHKLPAPHAGAHEVLIMAPADAAVINLTMASSGNDTITSTRRPMTMTAACRRGPLCLPTRAASCAACMRGKRIRHLPIGWTGTGAGCGRARVRHRFRGRRLQQDGGCLLLGPPPTCLTSCRPRRRGCAQRSQPVPGLTRALLCWPSSSRQSRGHRRASLVF